MIRQMRKSDRKMQEEDALHVLEHGEYGFLSTISEDNTPYVLPVNYIYYEGAIFFHCAKKGHKLDNIKYNSAVCFSVVEGAHVISKQFTSKFRSVIVFGKAEILDNDDVILPLVEIVNKYSADFKKEGLRAIDNAKDETSIVKITVEYISGKENK